MLLAFLGVATTFIIVNVLRNHSYTRALVPNCLMTRGPIIFLAGKRSFFYYFNYFNDWPDLLRKHGYDVHVVHSIDSLKEYAELIPEAINLFSTASLIEKNESVLFEIAHHFGSVTTSDRIPQLESLKPFPQRIETLNFERQESNAVLRWVLPMHRFLAGEKLHAASVGLVSAPARESQHARILGHTVNMAEREWA